MKKDTIVLLVVAIILSPFIIGGLALPEETGGLVELLGLLTEKWTIVVIILVFGLILPMAWVIRHPEDLGF